MHTISLWKKSLPACKLCCNKSSIIKEKFSQTFCASIYGIAAYMVVAHGRVVTGSCQITKVKQCWARSVLGWVTGARVKLPAMCRGVGQAFHIMLPLSTQQWWVPGASKNEELWMVLAAESALSSPQRRWDHIRKSSNTRGVNCKVCSSRWDIRL